MVRRFISMSPEDKETNVATSTMRNALLFAKTKMVSFAKLLFKRDIPITMKVMPINIHPIWVFQRGRS